jgi:hypothetical protein
MWRLLWWQDFHIIPPGNVPKELRKRALSIGCMEGFKVIRTYMPPIPAKGLANRVILFASFIVSSLFPIPLSEES